MKGKVDITPGEAMLVVIQYYQNQTPQNEVYLSQLKRWYLMGIRETHSSLDQQCDEIMQKPLKEESIEALQTILKDEACLAPYNIVYDDVKMSEDFSRRFFESSLSYEVLKEELKDISVESLQSHYQLLRELGIDFIQLFFSLIPTNPELKMRQNTLKLQNLTLEGNYEALVKLQIEKTERSEAGLMYEFSHAICGLRHGTLLPELSLIEREKIALILQCAFAAYTSESFGPVIDVYGRGIYQSSERGVLSKSPPIVSRGSKESVDTDLTDSEVGSMSDTDTSPDLSSTTHNIGILKSYQPVSQDEPFYLKQGLPYVPAQDRNNFNPDSRWAKLFGASFC